MDDESLELLDLPQAQNPTDVAQPSARVEFRKNSSGDE